MGMLALTRRVGEEVVIGDPKQPLGIIRVVDIHGDKVRLAFDFPRETPINRRELAEQKAQTASVPPTTQRQEKTIPAKDDGEHKGHSAA
ncbi:MAG: carbon storage regulator [Rhodospirillales bacterium]|nr:carbon storage regulator [Rhodospirillales bacterium]